MNQQSAGIGTGFKIGIGCMAAGFVALLMGGCLVVVVLKVGSGAISATREAAERSRKLNDTLYDEIKRLENDVKLAESERRPDAATQREAFDMIMDEYDRRLNAKVRGEISSYDWLKHTIDGKSIEELDRDWPPAASH